MVSVGEDVSLVMDLFEFVGGEEETGRSVIACPLPRKVTDSHLIVDDLSRLAAELERDGIKTVKPDAMPLLELVQRGTGAVDRGEVHVGRLDKLPLDGGDGGDFGPIDPDPLARRVRVKWAGVFPVTGCAVATDEACGFLE
jgi:hypothetical protein